MRKGDGLGNRRFAVAQFTFYVADDSGPRVTGWVEMKLRTGFVDSHRTPIEDLSMQRINTRLGFRCMCHLDKSDTVGLARYCRSLMPGNQIDGTNVAYKSCASR